MENMTKKPGEWYEPITTFPYLLEFYMETHSMVMRSLAIKCDVSDSTMKQYLKGDILPTGGTVKIISEALEVPEREFYKKNWFSTRVPVETYYTERKGETLFASTLRRAMKKLNLSPQFVAFELEFTPQAVTAWLDKDIVPSFGTLEKLNDILGEDFTKFAKSKSAQRKLKKAKEDKPPVKEQEAPSLSLAEMLVQRKAVTPEVREEVQTEQPIEAEPKVELPAEPKVELPAEPKVEEKTEPKEEPKTPENPIQESPEPTPQTSLQPVGTLPFDPAELSPIRFQETDWWVGSHIAALGEVAFPRSSVSNFISSGEALENHDYRTLRGEDLAEFKKAVEFKSTTSASLLNTVIFSPQLTVFSLAGVNAYFLWSKGTLGKAIRRYLADKYVPTRMLAEEFKRRGQETALAWKSKLTVQERAECLNSVTRAISSLNLEETGMDKENILFVKQYLYSQIGVDLPIVLPVTNEWLNAYTVAGRLGLYHGVSGQPHNRLVIAIAKELELKTQTVPQHDVVSKLKVVSNWKLPAENLEELRKAMPEILPFQVIKLLQGKHSKQELQTMFPYKEHYDKLMTYMIKVDMGQEIVEMNRLSRESLPLLEDFLCSQVDFSNPEVFEKPFTLHVHGSSWSVKFKKRRYMLCDINFDAL